MLMMIVSSNFGRILGGKVGMARKTYGIKLPNMQGIAGKGVSADQAHRFNCVQRGHHNPLETISCFRFCSLISGLVYPKYTAAAGLPVAVPRNT